jgi:hypothetical protein
MNPFLFAPACIVAAAVIWANLATLAAAAWTLNEMGKTPKGAK